MVRNWRLATLLVLAVVAAVLAVDWAMASSRLPSIEITTELDTPTVIADGRHTATFVVRVKENGVPRAGDLLQVWLTKGSGQLIPQWTFTDERGESRVSFTPNPYNRYDPQDEAEITIMDTSIGQLIEVGKRASISIPLVIPEAQ